jgi:hypothetical protein
MGVLRYVEIFSTSSSTDCYKTLGRTEHVTLPDARHADKRYMSIGNARHIGKV